MSFWGRVLIAGLLAGFWAEGVAAQTGPVVEDIFCPKDFFTTKSWHVLAKDRAFEKAQSADEDRANDSGDKAPFDPWSSLPFDPDEASAVNSEQARISIWQALVHSARDDWRHIRADFGHFYLDGENLTCLAIVLGGAAALANTHADQGIRDWYQDHVRNWSPYPSAEETARVAARVQRIQQTDGPEAASQALHAWRRERLRVPPLEYWAQEADRLGKHWLVVPVLIGSVAVGRIWEDYPLAENVGQWGERSFRALMVGAPAVAVFQMSLGAGRPEEHASNWRFFHDRNGVSGHAFVGAVPFLSAASMVENRPLKATLVAASFATAWARFHEDHHYLSQSILGWSIAWLAVRSVNQTERAERCWEITPIDLPQGPGLGLLVRF